MTLNDYCNSATSKNTDNIDKQFVCFVFIYYILGREAKTITLQYILMKSIQLCATQGAEVC